MKKHTRSDGSQSTITAGTSNSAAACRPKRKRVNVQWLKDFISEMLATERGGVQLYQRTLEQLRHEGLRIKLQRHLSEAEQHVRLCEAMLEIAGAEPTAQSRGAVVIERKLRRLVDIKVSREIIDINNVENLFLAETKNQWNWSMLRTLVNRIIQDDQLKTIVRKAVQKVERQACDHILWNQATLTKLSTEMATRSLSARLVVTVHRGTRPPPSRTGMRKQDK